MTKAEHYINVKNAAETAGIKGEISVEAAQIFVQQAEYELGNLTVEEASQEWED